MQTTAIILAAGFGSRFLPFTKAINKCMVPVGNKPVIQYVVEECIDAGIDDIVVMVADFDRSIRDYFSDRPDLETAWEAVGKKETYVKGTAEAAQLQQKVRFATRRYETGRYGSAEGVRQAMEHVPEESSHVVLLHGDVLFGYASGQTVGGLKAMMQEMERSGKDGILAGFAVSLEGRSKYGVLIATEGDATKLDAIIEKPGPGVSPESLNANAAWYVLPTSIKNGLDELTPDPHSGEYLFTDAVNDLARQSDIGIFQVDGVYLDCGNPTTWLAANNYVARQ